jgi:hypothetical protein
VGEVGAWQRLDAGGRRRRCDVAQRPLDGIDFAVAPRRGQCAPPRSSSTISGSPSCSAQPWKIGRKLPRIVV